MPNSHQRHKPKHHHQSTDSHHQKQRRLTAATFMMVMFGILGVCFAYFTSNGSLLWSIAGALAGLAIGYFFGNNMDKSARSKT